MKATMNMDSILETVRGLSETEQSSIAERILAMLSEQKSAPGTTRRELIPETINKKPGICPALLSCYDNLLFAKHPLLFRMRNELIYIYDTSTNIQHRGIKF